jgi:branched-chain amino acid transport system ATP-binding protein
LENPLLRIENVDVFYGDAQALWNVSFNVAQHKITALLGANGAGKSTLLKTISGVIRPKKGRILYSGRALVDLKPEKVAAMGISHVPEGRRLFSGLTVLENLELGAYLPSVRSLTKESLERVFGLFPMLKNRIHQAAGTLSGGEQQMLAIGRALMARPNLLLLDEPSLGLAPIVVKLLFDIIKVLNQDGVTILLVEQSVRKTLEIADYAFVLKTGIMRMEGQPAQLLTDPEFRQAFLGRIG